MLFVTSFDNDLFKASGSFLIDSFLRHQNEGRLLCCYEGNKPPQIDGDRILGYDITHDPFLVAWDSKYRKRCEKEQIYWRKRAWQWYRKIVSLRFASSYLPPRWLIWVDCDCAFKETIYETDLIKFSDNAGVFYLKGRREWTETGILIFNRQKQLARYFLRNLFDWYELGKFLDLQRWDDCWIFDTVRKGFVATAFCDLVLPNEPPTGELRVVERSRIAKFIQHEKGKHLRIGVRSKR